MEQQQLVAELCRVQDLVRELGQHLHASPSSVDQCRRLAAEIVALTDRSIVLAAAAAAPTIATTPPCSGAPSPLSDAGSDHPFAGSPKKRKATARWSGQVRVTCAADDDGHSWRKYGQKDILGARHPRAYYRCTHRNSQGCPATKQVQRTDADANVFDVVYHGEHTCVPSAAARRPPSQPQNQQHNPNAESLLQSLGARLTVTTADATVGVAVPPMTPESCPPRSPWSLASPVDSDFNTNGNNVYSDLQLQEVVSAFAAQQYQDAAEFMPQEYFSFDYNSFDMEPMPSLF